MAPTLEQTAAPAVLPVTVDQLAAQLRQESCDDPTLLRDSIATATDEAQHFTGRQFIRAQYVARYDRFPRGSASIEIPLPPLISVEAVKYDDTAGVEQTLDAATYTVDVHGIVGRIHLKTDETWPDTLDEPNAVRVEFACGYGTKRSDVPPRARSAVLMIAAHRYVNPEPVVVGSISSELPMGARHLLWSLRVLEAA